MAPTRPQALPRTALRVAAPRRGFTLIELLVTMAVIAILAGVLLPVIHRARVNAKIAATQTLLLQITGALGRYNEDWGHFPPDLSSSNTYIKFEDYTRASPSFTATMQATSEALYYYLANPNITRKHPYLELQVELQQVDYNTNKLPEVCDAWQRPFFYNRPGFSGQTATTFNTAGDPLHHTTTYDLFSVGPNGQTAGMNLPHPKGTPQNYQDYNSRGLRTSGYGDDPDDICSWK